MKMLKLRKRGSLSFAIPLPICLDYSFFYGYSVLKSGVHQQFCISVAAQRSAFEG